MHNPVWLSFQFVLFKFVLYSGLLKIRTRMCKDFWLKSGFFGQVFFCENPKVRIFRKNSIVKNAKARQNAEPSGSKACGQLIN